jgi:hypothetical protein
MLSNNLRERKYHEYAKKLHRLLLLLTATLALLATHAGLHCLRSYADGQRCLRLTAPARKSLPPWLTVFKPTGARFDKSARSTAFYALGSDNQLHNLTRPWRSQAKLHLNKQSPGSAYPVIDSQLVADNCAQP